VVAIEGARSYGIGLAQAAAAAGPRVIECGQPARAARHGRGKSDPIDAHLAVLYALRLDADRLPQPRADGDREALRILLAARADLVTAQTAQVNRLRALLRDGSDADTDHARRPLSDATLTALTRRRPPATATRHHAVRQAEIRRLATALRQAAQDRRRNRADLQAIVDDLARA
jgi:transposase